MERKERRLSLKIKKNSLGEDGTGYPEPMPLDPYIKT